MRRVYVVPTIPHHWCASKRGEFQRPKQEEEGEEEDMLASRGNDGDGGGRGNVIAR